MQVTANGIAMEYRVDGAADRPWLILSNPLVTDLSLWDAQVAVLGRSFRILRYDQRGHGDTDAPPGRYTFDLLADDLLALMDALAIERAHCVGLSMGAATAVFLASRCPDRLDRVALCDTSGASSELSHRQWEERIAQVSADGMASVVESLIQRWVAPKVLAAKASQIETLRRMILATPVAGFIGCAAAIGDYDMRPKLRSLKHRLLLLAGDKDVTAAGVMRGLHETLPNSSFVEIADAGHISSLDQPEAFARAIEAFLAAPLSDRSQR